MKPKQKHKRGASKYSLDFYTPLTRGECFERLRTKAKKYEAGYLVISRHKNKFTVRSYNPPSEIVSVQFYGQFEPYVAGTHISGNIRHLYDREEIRGLFAMGLIYGVGVCLLMGALVLSGFDRNFVKLVALMVAIPVVSLGLSYIYQRYNPRRTQRLLRWIEEQLNVEVAHETETQA
jgi:hypothetical protein